MIREVEKGKPVVIFPEGRIWNTGSLMKIYATPGFVAMRAKAKIYPVILKGLDRSRFSYLRKKNRTKFFPQVTISVGKAVEIEQDKNLSAKEMKEKIARITLGMFQDQLFQSEMKQNVNLYNELVAACDEFYPKSIVVEDFSTEMTLKDLVVRSSVFGRTLHRHLLPASRVGVFMPTAPAFVAILFGLFKFDRSPALLNYSMGGNTLADCCVTANLKQVITSRVFVEKGKLEDKIAAMAQHVDIVYLEDMRLNITLGDKLKGLFDYIFKVKSKATNNEVLLYTSGSENRPKGVVLTHTNIYANLKQARVKLDLTQRDKFFNALPIFHSFGLTAGTLLPILHGICAYLYPSPLHYRVIPEMIYAHDCTVLLGTSTFLKNWGKAAHHLDMQTVRYILAGAE
jgi:acyl-[acyl-carrier-protein]-phospholipid O-acyltransferase/long-chain-fatty-acid--[acyl-carrier-protein] ligase